MSTNNLNDNVYYHLQLFLDPAETDWAKLRTQIESKKPAFNKDDKTKPLAIWANDYLQWADNYLEQVSPGDPPETQKLKLQADLKLQAEEAKKARDKDLNSKVRGDLADGILEQHEYDATVKAFAGYFKEATIQEKYGPAYPPPPPFPPQPKPKSVAEGEKVKLEAGKLKTLQGELIRCDTADLYAFLAVSNTDSASTIRSKTASAKARWEGLPLSENEKKTGARNIFTGKYIEDVCFTNDDTKAAYDLYLKQEAFKTFYSKYGLKKDSKPSIEFAEWEHYIQTLKDETSLTEEEAKYFLYDRCMKEKIRLPVKIRTHKCPKCGVECRVVEIKCKCGLDFLKWREIEDILRKAQTSLENGDIESAKDYRKVNEIWREHCGGTVDSNPPGYKELTKLFADKEAELKEVQSQIDGIVAKVHAALRQRELYEAQRLLTDLRRMPHAKSYLAAEEKDIEKKLADVRAKLTQLLNLSDSPADIAKKIDICEEVIAVAADCKEAQTALAKYPPLPPSNLSAKVNTAGSVELTWTSPAARKPPFFVVVRKIGAAPASPSDGQTITDNISNTTFADSTCETGVIYGYAVFSKRDKVIEQTGCRSPLVQRIGELANITVRPADRSVTFAWKKPENCTGIQITRSTGSASGTQLPLQSGTGFTDSGLTNNTAYTYLFQIVFRTPDGKSVTTAGIKQTLKPQTPPPAVQDLRTSDAGGETTVQWTPPSAGEVLLFNTASVPEMPVGQTTADTPLELQKKYGESLPVLNAGQGQTCFRNTITGVRYIVPFTVHNGLATLGKPVTVLRVQDVTNLEARISGTKLFVSWEWQKGQEKVLLVYRNDKPPEGWNDQNATKKIVTKQEYDKEKSVVLNAEHTQDFYIKVFSVVVSNGKDEYSSGAAIQTGVSEIHWKLLIRRQYKVFGAIIEAYMQFDSRRSIPDLIVRKDYNRKPLGRNLGTFVMDVPHSSERSVTVGLDIKHIKDNIRFQVFVKDEASAGRYALYGQPDDVVKRLCSPMTLKDLIVELLFHPIRFIKQFQS